MSTTASTARGRTTLSTLALLLTLSAVAASAQSPDQAPSTTEQAAKQAAAQTGAGGATGTGGLGEKNTGKKPSSQKPADVKPATTDTNTAAPANPANSSELAASPKLLRLKPTDPDTPPTNLPTGRPVIGLALGGGGAEAMTEIGVLQWFEEHRIPVDVIAGTSMGSIIAALYSTGKTPEEMEAIMSGNTVDSVFRIQADYGARNFRRREDSREVPNAVTAGLKHGVSFRNSLLTDTGLNELLDKQFLRYNDQINFNDLPIPFRCQATDLTDAKTVTFSRGSLQDAVRASASIPGVFRPVELDGHAYVDGAILENLPAQDVKAMKADVVLAVSLPLEPAKGGDLDSILGVLQRTFAVGIENNEARDRKLANVVIMPDIAGFTGNDYTQTGRLAQIGYNAAEANKDALLPYALNQDQWRIYTQNRYNREHGPVGPVLMVKVKAPNAGVTAAVKRKFQPLVNQPVDTDKIESLLAELRSDGRYDADYSVGYDSSDSEGARRPIIIVAVTDKPTGPPFLDLGLNVAAQTAGVTRATIASIFTYQDFGGYGSELRAKFDFGFLTDIQGEYYRKLDTAGFFAAPRVNFLRQPFYIYSGNTRLSERQSQFVGPAADVGWSDDKKSELRLGWEFNNVQWHTTTGNDGLPDYSGNEQKVRVRYIYDSQDRALVPRFGIRSVTDLGYLYALDGSRTAPQLFDQIEVAHTFGKKNVMLLNAEGATMFNRNVPQPFLYTLGGPLRLSASAIDQYRGTDYFLVTPGYLRRIAQLPAPLGQSIYVGATYEAGQMRSPSAATLTRQDVSFGLVAETPLGVITVAPSFGNAGERKLTFTLGKFF
jgi:NTE family protein